MLRLTNLKKSFGQTRAVDDLSLAVERGEVLGVLGPNGAGKSTTVAMAVGALVPDSGCVEVAEIGGAHLPAARAKIGVAPQSLAIYEELTAAENIKFFARLHGLRGEKLAERSTAALDFVGLSDRRNHRVKTFSGGMKRRLNIAVAIVHDPPIVLFDEPTVGVDPQSRNAIFDNIEKLKAEGRAILYTTHYMEEAARLCDRVAIIDHGKLLALDTVNGLVDAHGGAKQLCVSYADGDELRVESTDPFADLLRLRGEREIRQFSVEVPTLEQVFLNLTGRHLRD